MRPRFLPCVTNILILKSYLLTVGANFLFALRVLGAIRPLSVFSFSRCSHEVWIGLFVEFIGLTSPCKQHFLSHGSSEKMGLSWVGGSWQHISLSPPRWEKQAVNVKGGSLMSLPGRGPNVPPCFLTLFPRFTSSLWRMDSLLPVHSCAIPQFFSNLSCEMCEIIHRPNTVPIQTTQPVGGSKVPRNGLDWRFRKCIFPLNLKHHLSISNRLFSALLLLFCAVFCWIRLGR